MSFCRIRRAMEGNEKYHFYECNIFGLRVDIMQLARDGRVLSVRAMWLRVNLLWADESQGRCIYLNRV